MKVKKKYKVLLIILAVLIVIRLLLPIWVKNYVNKVLDDVPGYSGSVEDIDLHLYRGAYKIQNLKMVKTDGELPVPFLDINSIDLSVHWKSLFKGKLVGEVILNQPRVNFVASTSSSDTTQQMGENADWTKPIKELMPLQINIFEIHKGKISYLDYGSKPKVDIALENIELEATNLGNVNRKDVELPSTITASATTNGNGNFTLHSKANLLKPIPDFDLDAQLENVDITALNDFTSAYAKLDFEGGTFNLYTEVAVSDGKIEGYVKPLLTDIDVFDLSADDDKPLRMIWEAIAGTVTYIFKNHPKDQFATKVPFEGDLNQIKTGIWPTIGNILKNTFIRAFTRDTDNTVSFNDLVQDKPKKK